MLRLLSDEDIPGDIVYGLRQRRPELEVVRVQDVELMNTPDAEILAWAAREGFQVVTRDRNTMTASAYERVIQRLPMLGIFVIPAHMAIGSAIVELEIIALASDTDDWRDRVIFLPL